MAFWQSPGSFMQGAQLKTEQANKMYDLLANTISQGIQKKQWEQKMDLEERQLAAKIAAEKARNVSGADQPANIREWMMYNQMSPEEQTRYLEMKRAQQIIDTGSAFKQVGQGGKVTQEFEKDLAPTEEVPYKEEAAAAVTRGGALGTAQAGYEDLASAMPTLYNTTDKLTRLAEAATYTKAGAFSDLVKRQLGVDVGDAAAAKAEYGNIVKSQMLPILKQTFGGSFSVQEGEWLLSTLGDEKLSPKEKQAQIEARMVGWEEELKTKARRVGKEVEEGLIREKKPKITTPPKKGTIKNGYVFMGGDPSDKNNWRGR